MASLIKVRGEDGQFIELPAFVGPHFTPSVDSNGNLSWKNNSDLDNPPDVNIKGPQGEPYNHSEEFTALAAQVRTDASTASSAATNAANDAAGAYNYRQQTFVASQAANASAATASNAASSALTSKEVAENAMNEARSARDLAQSAQSACATSETNAKTSETNAKTSETNSKTSENHSATSETRAKTSEINAKEYYQSAKSEADRAGSAAAEAVQVEADRATAAEGALSAEINEEKLRNDKQDARLANLEAAAQGKLYREEVDDSEAYIKIVPDGALPYAAVTSIGGRCEDVDGVIAVADVSEIKSGLKTITIPESIRNLPGYGESAGSIVNTLDFEAKTFTRKANKQNLGTADLHIGDSSSSVTWIYAKTYGMPQTWNQNTVYKNAIVAGYPSVAQASAGNYEKCTYLGYNNFWAIKDTNLIGMTVAQRKAALEGVILYKPAATQSVTDVSDDLKGFDTFLPVESGGEIIFENDAKLDVPSSVTFAINVQEAIANE